MLLNELKRNHKNAQKMIIKHTQIIVREFNGEKLTKIIEELHWNWKKGQFDIMIFRQG